MFANSWPVILSLRFLNRSGITVLWLTKYAALDDDFHRFILLVGIAAKNVIVLVAYEHRMRKYMPLAAAVRQGASARLCPKLMTGFVAMACLAPLARGAQEGGEILKPLFLAVIGGMPVSLLATLLLLPTAYWLVHDRQQSDKTTQ